MNLVTEDIDLIRMLKEKGIPTVALLISGRPMIIGELLPYSDAVLALWYPGTEGEGVAEVLFGDDQPHGQLTHSWPKNMAQIPINYGDEDYDPLYVYKHGLQYFPSATGSDSLVPYAAASNNDGSTISLALSDDVTTLNYGNGDFEIKIGGAAIPDAISNISLADFDESLLLIDLNTQIPQFADVSISYFGNGIVSSNLVLEPFTNYYVHNVSNIIGGTNYIPGRVEAENYTAMSGIQTEPCEDTGGGLNVGYIEAGDWMEYDVEVTQSGAYHLVSRISGYVDGTLLLTLNDTIQVPVDYTSTNGWQNWQSFSTDIGFLAEGSYVMKALAQSEGFNINYFNFEFVQGISTPVSTIDEIKVYPNPVKDKFQLDFTSANSHTVCVTFIDRTGKYAHPLYQGEVNPGENSMDLSIDPGLPTGLYFIEIKDAFKRYFRKIIIE